MDKGFKNVADFINNNDVNSECIVIYKNGWYDIIYNEYVARKIKYSDAYAENLSVVLCEELISKSIINFSFYENEEIIRYKN